MTRITSLEQLVEANPGYFEPNDSDDEGELRFKAFMRRVCFGEGEDRAAAQAELDRMIVESFRQFQEERERDLAKLRAKRTSPSSVADVIAQKPAREWVTRFNDTHTWEALLTADGWTPMGVRRDGVAEWCRPGKNPRAGLSATIGHDGTDRLYVFSSSLEWLPMGQFYDRWQYYVHSAYGGDFKAAARDWR